MVLQNAPYPQGGVLAVHLGGPKRTCARRKGTCVRSETCLEIWKVRHQTSDFVWINAFQDGAKPWKVRGNFLEHIEKELLLSRCLTAPVSHHCAVFCSGYLAIWLAPLGGAD